MTCRQVRGVVNVSSTSLVFCIEDQILTMVCLMQADRVRSSIEVDLGYGPHMNDESWVTAIQVESRLINGRHLMGLDSIRFETHGMTPTLSLIKLTRV